jgi:hypothetical protein
MNDLKKKKSEQQTKIETKQEQESMRIITHDVVLGEVESKKFSKLLKKDYQQSIALERKLGLEPF